jgi:hypothetical protein
MREIDTRESREGLQPRLFCEKGAGGPHMSVYLYVHVPPYFPYLVVSWARPRKTDPTGSG